MRLVRLDDDAREASGDGASHDSGPSAVSADVRAAVAAWGEGCSVLGGVAVFNCRPPGCPRQLDAVMVLPRGVVVVQGTDLPEPVVHLEAPLRTPWKADEWPLLRPEGAVNPGLEALESAAALARALQSRGLEPMPVAAVVAVGPYAGRITQPTTDLHRGLRVLSPSTTSLLAAARELATYERACPVEPAQRLLKVLDERIELTAEELEREGFPRDNDPDLATADTVLLPKVRDRRPAAVRVKRLPVLIAAAVAAVVLAGVLVVALTGRPPAESDRQQAVQRVDGIEFVQKAEVAGRECAEHSYGELQRWFTDHPCRALSRSVFATRVSGEPAAVAVTVVWAADEAGAQQLQELASSATTGGITDLVADGHGWPGGPAEFANAAQAVERTGNQVRIVQAVWAQRSSEPTDVSLRSLAERGLRLEIGRSE
ncbi:hypothetical protein [Saccharopolyspora rectivirgula]|uniref:hypothetical protein n=1 Tax=Saccharopolyspora rectivirgula TaxID=28042 RepID=UPI0004297BEA|nr:hypothetical protein [Saccharopolyspora rectivirgula]